MVSEEFAGSFPMLLTKGVIWRRGVEGMSRRTSWALIRPWLDTVTSNWNSSPEYWPRSIEEGSMVTTGTGTWVSKMLSTTKV